jgi:hypothetical protein
MGSSLTSPRRSLSARYNLTFPSHALLDDFHSPNVTSPCVRDSPKSFVSTSKFSKSSHCSELAASCRYAH